MNPPAFTRFGGEEVPPCDPERAGVVVLPICYENAVSYGTGTREGPLHLLEASAQLERIDDETLRDWAAAGIHTLAPLYPPEDPEAAVDRMQVAAEAAIHRGQFLLSIGGDHAVTLGPAAAAARRYPRMSVLQIDAHLDLRDRWNGSRHNHACVMRRIVEDLDLKVVPVGIRSVSLEELDVVEHRRIRPYYAHRIDPWDFSWIDAVVEDLGPHVYLTVDLDGLDPSVIPGTGTPEPGGLDFRQLTRLIDAVGSRRTVVAADITELVKIQGQQVSEFTAAKIAAKILSRCASENGPAFR